MDNEEEMGEVGGRFNNGTNTNSDENSVVVFPNESLHILSIM